MTLTDAQCVALMAALGFDDAPMGAAIADALAYLTEAKRQVREAEKALANVRPSCPACGFYTSHHPWCKDYGRETEK